MVPLSFNETLSQNRPKHNPWEAFLAGRGLTEVAERLGWQVDGRGHLVFPTGRYRPSPDAKPRNAKGAAPQPTLWVPDGASRDLLLVVEGETDGATAYGAGYPVFVVPGATTWRAEWWQFTAGYERVVVNVEADNGGVQLLKRLAATRPTGGPELYAFSAAWWPACAKDLNELHIQLGRDFGRTREALDRLLLRALPVVAAAALDEALHLLDQRLRPAAFESNDDRLAPCPFHDDHEPSLDYGERGFICHGCGAKGGLELLTALQGIALLPEGGSGGAETLLIIPGPEFIRRAQEQPLCWFVKPILAPGLLTLLCGKMRVAGKSTFLGHLLRALTVPEEGKTFSVGRDEVSFGPDFLGLPIAGYPERVLLVSEEPPFVWSERPTLDWSKVDVVEDFGLLADGWAAFERLVAEGPWDLIILDSLDFLLSLSGVTSENEAAEVNRVLGRFLTLARKHSRAVLVVDHLRKSDETGELEGVRGSGAKVGRADIILTLSPAKEHPHRRVLRAWSRFRLPGALAGSGLVVELAEDGSRYFEVGTKAAIKEREEMEELCRFVETYVSPEGVKLSEVAEACGKAKSTVARWLQKAVELGLVEKNGKIYQQKCSTRPVEREGKE